MIAGLIKRDGRPVKSSLPLELLRFREDRGTKEHWVTRHEWATSMGKDGALTLFHRQYLTCCGPSAWEEVPSIPVAEGERLPILVRRVAPW